MATPDEELLARIKKLGEYADVRMLDDGTIVGIGRLIFTMAIYVNLDLWGFEKRFCFDNVELAVEEYKKLTTGDDEPQGWIARRPEPEGFHDLRKGEDDE